MYATCDEAGTKGDQRANMGQILLYTAKGESGNTTPEQDVRRAWRGLTDVRGAHRGASHGRKRAIPSPQRVLALQEEEEEDWFSVTNNGETAGRGR